MSCSVAFLCFLSGCASWHTDSWCSPLAVIFLLTHLSLAEISFFCSVADQFSLQFATACKGWLLPVLQCLLLDYKTNKQEKRQLRSTTVETWRYFCMFIHSLIPWIQCRRKINPMKSLQHVPLCDGVLGELLLCLICDRYPSGRHRNALWRGMV